MRFQKYWTSLLMIAVCGSAFAAYPDKPIRLIVPFPPGGAADVMARGMARQLGTELSQQIVIQNLGGAGGQIAVETAAKATPDGYTLLFATMGTHAIKPGALTYGSADSGSSSHLSGAQFEMLTGVDLVHVPYKGSAPLMVDVLAGRIDMTFDSFAVYREHIKSGKVHTVLGIEPTFSTPEQFAALIRADLLRWAEIVKKSGASAE